PMPEETTHRIQFRIDKNAKLDGFLIWLTLHTIEGEVIDILENEYCWLPVYIPAFYPGVKVSKGDVITAQCTRTLAENSVNPDFEINGTLERQKGDNIRFCYKMPHFEKAYRANPFYEKLFKNDAINFRESNTKGPGAEELKAHLASTLPDYMIPSYFVPLETLPLTPNSKVDRKALPEPVINGRSNDYVPPSGITEKRLVEIWANVLNLKQDSIGITDDFFKLGGHSLKAAIMIAHIHKMLNVKLKIADIFRMHTVQKLSEYIKNAVEDKYVSIKPVEKKMYHPQSSAQKRIYILQQMEKESTAYNIQLMDIHYEGIDKTKLEKALVKLIRRHEILRTSFTMREGKALQKIHDDMNFKIEWYESWEGRGRNYDPTKWKKIAKERERRKEISNKRLAVELELPGVPVYEIVEGFVRPFELSKPPLLRVGLVNVRNIRQVLLMDIHHIITDGVSMALFMSELLRLYKDEELPPLKIQYKDFAQWADRERETGTIKKQEKYWLKQFAGKIPVVDLPTDHVRPAILSFDGDTLYLKIDEDIIERLNTMAQNQDATLYMLLLAAFNVLLVKLSGQVDLIVGTVTAGRRHADIQDTIGMFANTLPLRNFPRKEKNFKEFLAEVRATTLAAFENQDFQFEELVKKVVPERDAARNPIFDISFGLENEFERAGYLAKVMLPGKPRPYSFNVDTSMFDLTLIGTELEDGMLFSFEYNTKLYEMETIQRLTGYYKTLLTSICTNIEVKISRFDILPKEERKRLLYDFNDTRKIYPHDKTIHELFQQQVKKTPDHIALEGITQDAKHIALTYSQLNREANKLAAILSQKGITPNSITALIVLRSIEMIVAIIAVLKAGGAYLPVDPDYPQERI
ncbi:MAG: AMP-binding protein, partial [bacterium]|nr:AMP-binding protein [bacterium]